MFSFLNLTNKHSITFILTYIPTHLNVEAISLRVSLFQSGICFLTWLRLHFILWVIQRQICWFCVDFSFCCSIK